MVDFQVFRMLEQRRTQMPTEEELTRRIEEVKAALAELGDLRPGTLSEQYNVCRTPACRCKADPPQRHGPYHQLSYTHKGRSTTEHVAAEHLDSVAAQIANYRRLRSLVDDWVEAAIKLDRLRCGHPRKARSSSG
jgi:hypothetical protein